MACNTDWMRTNFPAWDGNPSIHDWILDNMLSFKEDRWTFFELPKARGTPIYLSMPLIAWIWRMFLISSLVSIFVLGPKNIVDLSILIYWLEASSYIQSKPQTLWHLVAVALQNKMESSAKWDVIFSTPFLKQKHYVSSYYEQPASIIMLNPHYKEEKDRATKDRSQKIL